MTNGPPAASTDQPRAGDPAFARSSSSLRANQGARPPFYFRLVILALFALLRIGRFLDKYRLYRRRGYTRAAAAEKARWSSS